MLGLGGGIFIVPILTLAYHLPIHTAIGTSIVTVAATSCAAASQYTKTGLSNIKLAMLLEISTTIGAVIGGLIAVYLKSQILTAVFGCILIYTSVNMLYRKERIEYPKAGVKTVETVDKSVYSFYDPTLQSRVTYKIRKIPAGAAASGMAGIISGLLGVGGGIIKVPVMNLWMGVPIKVAIGTSNLMIGITAASSAFIYFGRGYIYPAIVAPVVIGVILGAQVGSRLAGKAKGQILRKAFGVVMLIVSVLMFLKSANISPFA